MALLRRRRHDETGPFFDLLFHALPAFVMLFALALVTMKPQARTGVLDAKAEFDLITRPAMN